MVADWLRVKELFAEAYELPPPEQARFLAEACGGDRELQREVQSLMGIGDNEAALSWLERAYHEHSQALTYLKIDPVYDPLRANPRFIDLLRRVGLDR